MENEQTAAVNDIQHYIREHLKDPITLANLAKHVHYSPWYTAKLFKEATGKTIFEYLRALRLSAAAKALWDEDKKVVDVALDFTFDSHEGFTRAFAKQFDITPKAYQKHPIPLPFFTPFDVVGDVGKETHPMETKAVFVQIMERPKRKAIIRRAKKAKDYFAYCEEVPCSIWGVFTSIKEAIGEPIGMWLSDVLRKKGTSVYVQGVEVPLDYHGDIPEGCELIELPATQMMIFQGEPYDDANFESEVSAVMEYVARFNPRVYGYEYDDKGYRFQYEPQGYRGYIEGRTVKKI